MSLRIRSDNAVKKSGIISLTKVKTGASKRLAELLNLPKRRGVSVNVWKIGKYSKSGALIAVPGKVLSTGRLEQAVTVAAYAFSKGAREKILAAGGKCLKITELGEKELKAAMILR